MHLTPSIILSLLRSSGMQGSVSHSLPGLTIIWRADYREWSLMLHIQINSHIRHPSGLAILGPLLFVIFINDMPLCVSSDTCIALFADDAKLYRAISSTDDQVALNWKMNINQMICKAYRILGLIPHTCNDAKDPLLVKFFIWHMSDLFWNTGLKFGIHLPRVSLLLLKEFKGRLYLIHSSKLCLL